jgi:hypothetical protein
MNQTKVRTVESLQLTISSVTGRVTIRANGATSTGGWTNPTLVDTCNPPADGHRHFDFVATRPDRPSTDAITPISAQHVVQAGAGTFCVVVHAATNQQGPECIEVEIGDRP